MTRTKERHTTMMFFPERDPKNKFIDQEAPEMKKTT
jgi:hypothetical protein